MRAGVIAKTAIAVELSGNNINKIKVIKHPIPNRIKSK